TVVPGRPRTPHRRRHARCARCGIDAPFRPEIDSRTLALSTRGSMPQLRLLLATLAVVVLTALVPSPTRAQNDDERARSHFLAGRSYMDQARYDEAAEQFAEAYA